MISLTSFSFHHAGRTDIIILSPARSPIKSDPELAARRKILPLRPNSEMGDAVRTPAGPVQAARFDRGRGL
jgi:hypothetical protein